MKRFIKSISILLLLCLALAIFSGCHKNDAQQKVDRMLNYINNKYTDDSFTYKGPFGGGAGADTKTIIVSSKNYPDKDVYVRHSFNDGDVYTDNYLGVRYAAQTESTIRSILDALISYDYLLFYEVDRFACPNVTGELDFEEYIANDASCIGFTVVVDGILSNKESFETALRDAVVNKGICCSATIYFDNDSGKFNELETEGLSGYTFKKLYSDVFSFKMSSNKEFASSQWGD